MRPLEKEQKDLLRVLLKGALIGIEGILNLSIVLQTGRRRQGWSHAQRTRRSRVWKLIECGAGQGQGRASCTYQKRSSVLVLLVRFRVPELPFAFPLGGFVP